MTSPRGNRSAFTAVELVVVMSVVSLLATMTVTDVLQALRKSAVNQASNAVEEVVAEARALALRAHSSLSIQPDPQFAAKRYGVVIVDATGPEQPAWVGVTWGRDASPSSLLRDADGDPVARVELPGVLRLFSDDEGTVSSDQEVGWMLDHRTAAVIPAPSQRSVTAYLGPSSLGSDIVNPSGVRRIAPAIRLATPDGMVAINVHVRPTGTLDFVAP
jgi:prepilin-type N-terminal cleavage/methylation domain-containing protein